MTNANQRRMRVLGAVAAATLAAAVLAGCSNAASPTASKSSDPITLFTDNAAWKPGFQAVGDELKKITGRGLEMQALPDAANFQQTLEQSLGAKPADIVKSSNGLQLQRLAASGNLTDLTSVWDEAVKKGWLDDGLRPYYSHDGKVYAVPMTGSVGAVFYNKALFKQYGLEEPKTYADFEKIAETLKQNGVTPMWSSGIDGWTPYIFFQAVAGAVSPEFYLNLSKNKATFADQEGRDILTTWQKWYKNGWTTPYDTKFDDAAAMLKSGKIGMFPAGTWAAAGLKGAGMEPGTEYGAFVMPPSEVGGTQAAFWEGNGFAVPKRAPHHDDAVKQIAAWLDPAVQKVWANYLGDASANKTVAVDNPVVAGLIESLNKAKPTWNVRYFDAVPPALVTDASTVWGNFMLHPDELDKTIEQLDAAAKKDWALWEQQTK